MTYVVAACSLISLAASVFGIFDTASEMWHGRTSAGDLGFLGLCICICVASSAALAGVVL